MSSILSAIGTAILYGGIALLSLVILLLAVIFVTILLAISQASWENFKMRWGL